MDSLYEFENPIQGVLELEHSLLNENMIIGQHRRSVRHATVII